MTIHLHRDIIDKTSFAFDLAWRVINENENDIRDFIKNANTILESTMYHTDFDDPKYNRIIDKFTSYPSDIKDSGVTIKDNNIVCGNINQLRKFLTYTNNHNRYCRCSDKYMNEYVNKLLGIGGMFEGLFEKYDSFDEYYHNAIVD